MPRLLLIGGSGFVGKSIETELLRANYGNVTSVSSGLHNKLQQQTEPNGIQYLNWDIRTKCKMEANFDAIVHTATPTSSTLITGQSREIIKMVTQGMQNVVEFASRHKNAPKVLFTSSGAVYGEMPLELERFPENWNQLEEPEKARSPYAEGKVLAESILSDASKSGKCVGLIARLFTFSGVNLPLDKNFAIGNFVHDAVSLRTITVRGDGSPIRSYMDDQDLARWLLRILEVGLPERAYHVGSERQISIRELADITAMRAGQKLRQDIDVNIQGLVSSIDGTSRYVPSTIKSRGELGVDETITLEESIDAMINKAIKKVSQ